MAWWEFGKKGHLKAAHRIYLDAVGAARMPMLYQELLVPDTFDGRFDMVVLQVSLYLRRLEGLGDGGRELAKELVGFFVDDMDRNLREQGVGDLGVGKRVKQMVQALYGRLKAYSEALASKDRRGSLKAALSRNVYAGAAPSVTALEALADYVEGRAQGISALTLERFLRLDVDLPPPGGATVGNREEAGNE